MEAPILDNTVLFSLQRGLRIPNGQSVKNLVPLFGPTVYAAVRA